MRVGVSLRSSQPAGGREGVRAIIEEAAAARDAGLDSLFLGDHHAEVVPFYQNSPTLGRLLAEWGERPAGALFLLPLWHPVLLAEQVATLACLAAGRFILQCALGGGEGQFGAMGVPLAGRARRLEASLDLVARLLKGEEVTAAGPWRVQAARIAPVPPEPVEIWIAGQAASAIDRAARLADGWVAAPWLTPEEARVQLDLYRERCAAHGRAAGSAVIRRDVHVGSDPADAARVAAPVLAAGYRGFDPRALVYGGLEQVIEQLNEFAAMGYSEVLVRHFSDDRHELLASFGRLAAVHLALAQAD